MRRLVLSVTLPLLMWCWVAAAQENGSPVPPEPGTTVPETPVEPPARPVEETLLPIYLKDKEGRLQAAINWTIEELEELYQLKHQLRQPDQAPRYSVQWMSADGTATDEHADLTIRFKVLVRDEQWVRVPLHLEQAVLREAVTYQGSGEQFLHFEEEGEGYVSWIRGAPGEQHQLTLKVLVPLVTVGEETRLRLFMPRATSSDLKLRVPMPRAEGEVFEAATLLPPAASGKDATEFSVLGLGGDFELSWHQAASRTTQTPPVLEAVGAVLARVDSRSVQSEARLTVRSYGGPFDRFRVLLPKEAELIAGTPSGYSVLPVSPEAGEASDQRLVEIRFPKKTAGPVEVRLSTRQTHDASGPNEWFELAGFEVVEAVRQWGHIGISTVGDWQVLWGPSRGVRQIDELPEALQGDDVVAGFEYFSQPCTLTARVVPVRTRISVEPEYVLLVDADQVRLEAKLKYTVRGSKVFALDVELPGWQFDKVGPDNLVAAAGAASDPSGVLSIPLLQPSTGQIEVSITAHRAIGPEGSALKVPLPSPRADSLGPAAVVVWPADNVELTPKAEALQGLILQQVAPQIKLPEPARRQVPLFYRGETASAVFAADVRVHSQSILVDVDSQVSVVEESAEVEQKFSYRIDYEPLDKLTIAVPRSLAGSEELEVFLDGQRLSPAELPDPAAEDDDSQPVQKRITLRPARIGPCELVVRYPVPIERLLPKSSVMCTVPLVMPVEGELASNKLYVTTKPGVRVEPREGTWSESEEETEWLPERRGLQLAAPDRTGNVLLAIHLEDPEALGSTVVERAWVQTWLTGSSRQDRAVFRFTSNQKEIEVIVPAGVELEDVKVTLDRGAVEPRTTPEGRLRIALANDANHRPHWLELHYPFAAGRSRRGQLTVELPRLGRGVWVRRVYWQLVLPSNEHVIVAPAGFTPEFNWGWSEVFLGRIPIFISRVPAFWGRVPVLEQPQLETWAGATHLRDVPEATSRYLFSTMGPVAECEVRTASRSFLVLVTSGAVLLVGMLLIYVPASRHPATLLAGGVLLVSVAALYPGATLQAAQAGSLGLVLTLCGVLLYCVVARRRRGTLLRETASAILEGGSTQSQVRLPLVGSRASTQTAPAAVSLPPSDSHP